MSTRSSIRLRGLGKGPLPMQGPLACPDEHPGCIPIRLEPLAKDVGRGSKVAEPAFHTTCGWADLDDRGPAS